jgi:P27 family predicted phage terminase small subunit
VGVPPDDLTPARKTIWWETVHAAPHLTRADRRALKTYVVAYDLWEQSVRMVDAKGLVTVDARHKKTPRSAPWERVERSRAQVVASLADKLGLSPAGRSNLHLPAVLQPKVYPPGPDGDLARMLDELDEQDRAMMARGDFPRPS